MSLDTYANLKTAIASLLNRTDLSTPVSDFVSLCEAEVGQLLTERRIVQGKPYPRRMRSSATGTLSSSDNDFDVPSDMLEPLQLSFTATDPVTVLAYLDPQAFDAEVARDAWTGKPRFWTVKGTEVVVYPAADASYAYELQYVARIAALSDVATTNWLLTYYPNIYLYGSAKHSAPYLMADGRLAVWEGLFQQGMEALFNSDPLPSNKTLLISDVPRANRIFNPAMLNNV